VQTADPTGLPDATEPASRSGIGTGGRLAAAKQAYVHLMSFATDTAA
jgi:hypothetical protein